jgi:hypothetical protein
LSLPGNNEGGAERAGKMIAFQNWSIREYLPIIIAGMFLFLPSLVLFPVTSSYPNALEMCRQTLLCSARISPWGIVTSLFIYDSWANFVLYAILVIFFILTQFLISEGERRKRQIFLSVVMYIIAIVVNLVWIVLAPSSGTYGPSGVLYAAWGVVSGFALFNGLSLDQVTRRLRIFSQNRVIRAWAVVNLFTIAVFVLYLGSDTSLFLSESRGVNLFAHGMSFLGGFFATYAYRALNKSVPIRDVSLKREKLSVGS